MAICLPNAHRHPDHRVPVRRVLAVLRVAAPGQPADKFLRALILENHLQLVVGPLAVRHHTNPARGLAVSRPQLKTRSGHLPRAQTCRSLEADQLHALAAHQPELAPPEKAVLDQLGVRREIALHSVKAVQIPSPYPPTRLVRH